MSEALALTWADVDLKNKRISITKNSHLIKGRDEDGNPFGGYKLQTQNSTKTESGGRTVPVNKSAEGTLEIISAAMRGKCPSLS